MTVDTPSLALLFAARGEPAWAGLLAEAGSAAELCRLPDRRLTRAGLDDAAVGRLRSPDPAALERWRQWLAAPGRELRLLGSPGYPQPLAQIPDPPLALWLEGRRPDLLAAPQIAIVGSRNATRGGRLNAEGFARYLSERGIAVVSGLAAGADAAGHEGALHGCGGTLAVFGSGLDTVFPRHNAALAGRIADAGLLVSEYPPGTPPLAHHFPQRNRIIAGLSLGTLVVEAGRRSGSLITARRANDYGREVFAIPGSIHNPLARGCHALIRQGAKIVEEAEDMLVELRPQLDLALEDSNGEGEPGPANSEAKRDPAYAKLLNDMGFEPVGIADLALCSGLTAAELSSMLLVLELEGLVEALPGGRYCRL